MLAFDVAIAISYAFTFPSCWRVSRFRRAWDVLGAESLAYLMTATAVIRLHFVLNLIRRQLVCGYEPYTASRAQTWRATRFWQRLSP